jgi:hypothetical protein
MPFNIVLANVIIILIQKRGFKLCKLSEHGLSEDG